MTYNKPVIIARGGNAAHLPDHTIEACLSAYTAGADGLMLTVQETSDNHLLLYGHSDLSVQTDGQGPVAALTFDQIMRLDAGAKFSPGQDMPWVKNVKVHRFLRLSPLDILAQKLEDNVAYFLRPGLPSDQISKRVSLGRKILNTFVATNRVAPLLVAESADFLEALHSEMPDGSLLALDMSDEKVDIDRVLRLKPAYIFAPRKNYEILSADIQGSSVKLGLILEANGSEQDLPPIVLSADVTNTREALGSLVTALTENWPGHEFDLNRWVAGISSGHHIMRPMLGIEEYNEPVFCASTTVNDGLRIKVVEGKTYASSGVVSRFSLGGSFVADVDFTYDNPQVANMMVLAVINQEVWPSYYHKPGLQENPSPFWQNHAFDSHGAAPFVSMEREEDDGFRIMKYTSVAGVYEWYGNYYLGDVGNDKSTKGRLRLERRGRFFSGYYQDENNDDWIGVGTLENASMNSRVYLRLQAKHYPKRNAPDPLRSLNVTYNNLVVRRPRGPVYQDGISRNPMDLLK